MDSPQQLIVTPMGLPYEIVGKLGSLWKYLLVTPLGRKLQAELEAINIMQ